MSRYLKKKTNRTETYDVREMFELFWNQVSQLIFYIMKGMFLCVCEKNIKITEPMDKSTCAIKTYINKSDK